MSADTFSPAEVATIEVGDVIWLATTVGAEPVTAIVSGIGGVITLITPTAPYGFHFFPEHLIMRRVPAAAHIEQEWALL